MSHGIPSIIYYSRDRLYDHSGAHRFGTQIEVKSSIGFIVVKTEDYESDGETRKLVISPDVTDEKIAKLRFEILGSSKIKLISSVDESLRPVALAIENVFNDRHREKTIVARGRHQPDVIEIRVVILVKDNKYTVINPNLDFIKKVATGALIDVPEIGLYYAKCYGIEVSIGKK
uniref:THUMP domain-containing protein n=1 Tax=Rhizobium phage IG49 TaxID=3129228 RepID=A0AAU8HZ07_9CAUD